MSITQSLTTCPNIFEVYFYTSPKNGSLVDRLFNKANIDYHRMYNFKGDVVHLAVRFGANVYEVTTEGTVRYVWEEALLDDPRMIGFFTADISHIDTNKRLAALFTLENFLGRKLDVLNCLRYLWETIGIHKSDVALERLGVKAAQDQVNVEQGSFVKLGSKEKFHLPFTCATLVNVVLNRLLDYEPGFTGHLAQSACMTLSIFAEFDFGTLYELEDG